MLSAASTAFDGSITVITGTALGVLALAALFGISLYVMFENLSGLLPANL
mgnify:CR=1 FL=1